MTNFNYYISFLIKIWWLWLVIIFSLIATYRMEKLEKEVYRMKKLEIIYNDKSKTTLKNTKNRFTNRLVRKYLDLYCRPTSKVKSAILYTYPLKDNNPLVLIKDGKEVE